MPMDNKEFYLQIRDQIKHEDNLTNNRMSWLISLQSFLFGAYGFTANSTNADFINVARSAFTFMGVTSSIAVYLSLLAARHSINKLVSHWYSYCESKNISDIYPPIIGTYTPTNKQGTRLGILTVLAIPILCISVWSFIGFGLLAAFCTLSTVFILQFFVERKSFRN